MSRTAVLWDEWTDEDWFVDPLGSFGGGSPIPAVTFPTSTSLVGKVYIAIGADLSQPPTSWVWTDITAYVRFDPGIATRQGRPDWTSTVRTSAGQLTLDNRDGRFARRNPNSPYFGSLTFNTPIWATVDAGSGPSTRMAMFVNEWPTRWSDRSGTDSTVPIQCAGIMRRLQQGEVLKSAMRRRILSPDEPTPVAYWPCEEGSDATVVVSGLASGHPMTPFAAGALPAFGAGFGGTAASLDFLGMSDDAGVVASATLPSASGFQVEFMVQSDAAASISALMQFECGGLTGFTFGISSGTADGLPHHIAMRLVQNGPDVDNTEYLDGVAVGGVFTIPGITLSTSLSVLSRNPAVGTSLLVAQLAIYGFASMNVPTTRFPAATAYAGELATTRIRRLATEEGVPMVCTSGISSAMGAQPIDTFLNILRDCESVDGGVLYETNWGLGFQALDDRTNEPVSLALDFDRRHIAEEPEPADDDQRLRNKWTVSRTSGSSATAQLTSGPYGTQAGGPGLYDDSATVNVETDTQLSNQANWRLHLSTVDEDRWPSIAIRLVGTPDLIPTWAAMPFGARLTAANPPTQVAPDTIDAIVEGWTERWDTKSWEADLATSPYSPYRIAIVDDPAAGTDTPRVGSGTATLAVAINTTDTSLSVTTGAGGLWTTLAADFPLDINIGGERIRLSAIAGAASPQTFTVSARSVNGIVKSDLAGASVEVWQIATVGMGGS